ncbi:GtrA family protein [Paucibacter sp. B2R-40]|uniref:GtrA family protein n=1 Tax=Paucibacter sp. B2R-40 TaxID=2893554 RepID=UPI0021E3FAA1|nr:GtrA family protein [Paucibacter sp. B2R-40]MCV2353244.1 GtrA family protein [Paucibacter sp. B2R-40]
MSSLLWFGLVGASAAAVHLSVVWLLVSKCQMAALLANVLGFVLAFGVSFVGHHRLSFGAQQARALQALPRFALVALLGFAVNELLYALLLAAGLDYRLALFLVLLAVAAMTWMLSRFWAFRSTRTPPRT